LKCAGRFGILEYQRNYLSGFSAALKRSAATAAKPSARKAAATTTATPS
jgi:hypothetical protein